MSKIKAVIFDMDGLMFDTESLYYKANQQTADRLGLPFDYAFYEKYIGASDKEFFNAMYEANDEKELVDAFVEQSDNDARTMFFSGQLKKKPGLDRLLAYLNKKKIQKIVASSTERTLVEQLIAEVELRDYFIDVVGGNEVEHSKPHPEIFLKALKKLETKKEETLVLEDSLNGVRSAYSAGIPVVMVPDLFVPNDEVKEKAAAIKNDLNEVIDFIEKIK